MNNNDEIILINNNSQDENVNDFESMNENNPLLESFKEDENNPAHDKESQTDAVIVMTKQINQQSIEDFDGNDDDN